MHRSAVCEYLNSIKTLENVTDLDTDHWHRPRSYGSPTELQELPTPQPTPNCQNYPADIITWRGESNIENYPKTEPFHLLLFHLIVYSLDNK